MIKITPRLVIQALIVATAVARFIQIAQASNMPTQPNRRATVLPFKGERRVK